MTDREIVCSVCGSTDVRTFRMDFAGSHEYYFCRYCRFWDPIKKKFNQNYLILGAIIGLILGILLGWSMKNV